MSKISLAVPYHDTPKTAFYLSRLLNSVAQQSFKDYEMVLTKEGPFARNHNAAITKATGEYVQMLQMDDYFAHADALTRIVEGLEDHTWQITGCIHDDGTSIYGPHTPSWTDDIYTGNNRLGSVSTLSFKREQGLFFEEPLTWLVDVDLYYRMYLRYGYPHINGDTGIIVNTTHDRLSSTLSKEIRQDEYDYLLKKYAK